MLTDVRLGTNGMHLFANAKVGAAYLCGGHGPGRTFRVSRIL